MSWQRRTGLRPSPARGGLARTPRPLPGRGRGHLRARSRRPKTTPHATPTQTVDLIIEIRQKLTETGLDAGPDTIGWQLEHHHSRTVSRATIARQLVTAGLVTPDPKKKRSRPPSASPQTSSTSAGSPTSPTTGSPAPDRRPGADTEILNWLDDHCRYALTVTAHHQVTGPIVLAKFRTAVATHGIPASTLTDNGMVFTTRLSGGSQRGTRGRNSFEVELHRLGIVQKNSRPSHPNTCGKVERFQQTAVPPKSWGVSLCRFPVGDGGLLVRPHPRRGAPKRLGIGYGDSAWFPRVRGHAVR